MVKFTSSEDGDFQTISEYLSSMINKASERIAEKWEQESRQKGQQLSYWVFTSTNVLFFQELG
jgi:hypothetical protein